MKYHATVSGPGKQASRVFAGIGVVLIGLYFFLFAGGGIWADFSPDDLMNLHHAQGRSLGQLAAENVLFYSGLRPLGSLLYKSVYEIFRLSPLPLHLVCFLLAFFNLGLLFLFAARTSGSAEIGIFTALIGAFHTNFLPLYYNAGMCYDLLSFAAYYGALTYNCSIRRKNQYPTGKQSILILLLYICALNAKEISITLPIVIAAYELIYHPARRDWIRKEGRLALLMLPVAAVYAAGKLYGPETLTQFDYYTPKVNASMYLRTLASYMDELSYRMNYFTPAKSLLFCCGLAGITLATRSRYLRFSFALLFIGLLPIALIPPRGLYAAYLPLVGLWAFGAVVLVRIREALNLLILRSEGGVFLTQIILFGIAAGFLIRTHTHAGAFDVEWITGQEVEIRHTIDRLAQLNLHLERGARVLIVRDKFDDYPWGKWLSLYMIHLYYHDPSIGVGYCLTASEWTGSYAAVLTYENGELTRLTGCQGRACCDSGQITARIESSRESAAEYPSATRHPAL